MSTEQDWATRRQASKRVRKRNTVLTYLVILFAAAFVLLLLSFFSQHRANEAAIDSLEQTSNSATQSLQNIINERDALKEQTTQLEKENTALKTQLNDTRQTVSDTQAALDSAKAVITALDNLNRLRTLYNQSQYRAARELLTTLEADGSTEAALAGYVDSCSEEQLELYNPLEAYQNLKRLLG